MKTVILYPRYDEDTQMIWEAATRRGWPTIRGSVSAAQAKDLDDVCIYGGVMWGERVAASLGVSLAWPDDSWLTKLPYSAVRRSIVQRSGEQVRGLGFPNFVKSLNWKTIASRTYFSKDDLPPNFDDREQFLVSEVVTFEREFRAFVLDKSVLTVGPYAKDGLLNYEVTGVKEALGFLNDNQELLSTLPRAVAVDVGFIKDRGWAFIEANPAWCSGIYTCDPDNVLDVVAACTLTNKDLNSI